MMNPDPTKCSSLVQSIELNRNLKSKVKIAVGRPPAAGCGSGKPSVRVLEGIGELHDLRPAWGQLLAAIPRATIFSTWEWATAWWNAFGDSFDLITLAVSDRGGRLVGLAPLCVHKERFAGAFSVRLVRILGDGSGDSDNLDVLAAPGWEPFVVAALLDYLEDNADRWNLAQFNSFSDESAMPGYLLVELQRRAWRCHCRQQPGVVLDLRDGWEGYLERLSPRQRRRVRNNVRLVEQGRDFRIRKCEGGPRLWADLASFFELHQRRWESKGERGSFGCIERRQFYQELSSLLAPRGCLELWLLEAGGRPVAGEFDLRYRNTVYNLQAGFDPAYAAQHPGYVLRSYVLQQSINSGALRYDFLSGNDAYKQRWAGRLRAYHDIQFALPGTSGGTYLRLAAGTQAAKTWLRPHVPPRLWAAARRLTRELRSGTVPIS